MKRTLLCILLVLSLAVNAGVLGVFLVNKYKDWRWQETYWHNWLKSKAALKTLDSLFAAHASRRESLAEPYWQTRRELGRLALEPHPDSARVEELLSRLAGFDRRVNVHWLDLVLGMRAVQLPERIRQWRERSELELDSARRADSVWYAWRAAWRAERNAKRGRAK
jgi:hypothetical protein